MRRTITIVGGLIAAIALIMVVGATNFYLGSVRLVYDYDEPDIGIEQAMSQLERDAKETSDERLWEHVNRYHTAKQIALEVDGEWRRAGQQERFGMLADVMGIEQDIASSVDVAIQRYRDIDDDQRADRIREILLVREAKHWRWVADSYDRFTRTTQFRELMDELEQATTRQEFIGMQDEFEEIVDTARERAKLAEAGTPWRP